MIQAQNPETIPTNNPAENITVTKVHGFSKPKNPQQVIPEKEHSLSENKIIGHIYHWWHKIAIVLLSLHSLHGLWESTYFIAVEYPELNELLELHIIESSEVNHLLSKAIISLIVTIVNILFTIRLAKVKETTAHNIDLLVATFLIITTSFIRNFLIELDLINLLMSFV